MYRLRDTIDNIMTTNRELGLIVAMESALNDERFEVGAGSAVCYLFEHVVGTGILSLACWRILLPQEAAALCEKLKELQGEETEKRISDGAWVHTNCIGIIFVFQALPKGLLSQELSSVELLHHTENIYHLHR